VAAVGVCAKETFEYGDWEAIKETLARASELCDRASPSISYSYPALSPIKLMFDPRVCMRG
jgi:hypothetical protein